MKRIPMLPIGTTVWVVEEHLYHIPGQASPLMEYAVCQGKVHRHNVSYGREAEVVIQYKDADGFMSLRFVRLRNIKKSCYSTPAEAAEFAKELTERFENRGLGRYFNERLRRPWEKYLMEE